VALAAAARHLADVDPVRPPQRLDDPRVGVIRVEDVLTETEFGSKPSSRTKASTGSFTSASV